MRKSADQISKRILSFPQPDSIDIGAPFQCRARNCTGMGTSEDQEALGTQLLHLLGNLKNVMIRITLRHESEHVKIIGADSLCRIAIKMFVQCYSTANDLLVQVEQNEINGQGVTESGA